MKRLNLIISIVILIILSAGVMYLTTHLSELKALDILALTMAISIYINGIVARMIHMSRVKMESISYNTEYSASEWHMKDLGLANVLPVVMEIQYTKNLSLFIDGVIESYKEEEMKIPVTFTVAKILLKIWIYPVIGLLLLLAMFILPKFLNDYTLYRGLDNEELHTAVMGLGIYLQLAVTTLFNYTMFKVVDYSMESYFFSNKFKKWFMVFAMFFVVYTGIMVLFILFMGITGITIPVFNTVINTNMLSLFIVTAPILSVLQAFIVKGKLNSYQYVLNEELN